MKNIVILCLMIGFSNLWANSLPIDQIINKKQSDAYQYLKGHEDILSEIRDKQFNRMKSQLNIKDKPQDGILIFISFSMPKESIRQILAQAKAYNIPVVIRGLVDNSFYKTKKTLDDILKADSTNQKSLDGAVELNPIWFRQFDIKKVPAFVSFSRGDNCQLGKPCNDIEYDILYGNISVGNALDVLSKKGSNDLTSIVDLYLAKHKEKLTWNV